MRLIRLISCVADWADERQIRVDYVVPHKIGLVGPSANLNS